MNIEYLNAIIDELMDIKYFTNDSLEIIQNKIQYYCNIRANYLKDGDHDGTI